MMKEAIQSKLHKINQDFYDRFAGSFSATRSRIQPGVQRLVKHMLRAPSLLDIGCGNGTLAEALAAQSFNGRYLGLDLSQDLLDCAAARMGEKEQGKFKFRQADLSDPGWLQGIAPGSFNWLVSFAVLHHLPGEHLRRQTVKAFARLVSPQGCVAVSVWQWFNSPRLRQRVLDWGEVGLDPNDLDPGDVLLNWRAGETIGLRYVHTFDEAELTGLANCAGFQVINTFLSDGKPGNLALYQVWQHAG